MELFYRQNLASLHAWNSQFPRKPLIIRGARQTGKTALVRLFAAEKKLSLLELNLEDLRVQDKYRPIQTILELEQQIALDYPTIALDNAILFIDEIQALPHFVSLLRFIKEQRPKWRVIAAGSLLEPFVTQKGMAFPVGRVSFLEVYPVTFTEFALALQKVTLVEAIDRQVTTTKPSPVVHRSALSTWQEYLLVGGMPEAVAQYRLTEKPEHLDTIYQDLLFAYREDTYSYASRAKSTYLTFLLQHMPGFAGTISSYTTIGKSQYRHREMKEALEILHAIYVISRIPAAEQTTVPLSPNINRQHKWLFLDFGFLPRQAGILYQYTEYYSALSDQFRGRLLEQYVGQSLLALSAIPREQLFYWAKPKSKGEAEVDFCFSWRGHIVGLEIKSSRKPISRSLLSLYDASKDAILIQADDGPLRMEMITFNKKTYPLIRLPLYMIDNLPALLDHYLESKS